MKTASAPGSPATHFLSESWAEQEAKHIAAPAVTPTRPGINCIFISALSECWARNQMQNVQNLSHFLPPLSPSVLSPLAYQFIIDHSLPASCCSSLCAVLTLKYHPLRDPGFARGISENHSSNLRPRRRERYLTIASDRRANIKFHVLAPWSINYVNL